MLVTFYGDHAIRQRAIGKAYIYTYDTCTGTNIILSLGITWQGMQNENNTWNMETNWAICMHDCRNTNHIRTIVS
jgi:hypothetical protein